MPSLSISVHNRNQSRLILYNHDLPESHRMCYINLWKFGLALAWNYNSAKRYITSEYDLKTK